VDRLRRAGINRVVASLSFARMADAMGNSILVVIIPLYVAELAYTASGIPESLLVGILISIYGLVFTFFQPLYLIALEREGSSSKAALSSWPSARIPSAWQ